MRMPAVTMVLVASCQCAPPAGVAVVSAEEVGLVPQSSKIMGHDGASSSLLFGHSVWLYGDTVLTQNDGSGSNWHSNSFAWTDDVTAADGVAGFAERLDDAGTPVPLIANTTEEMAFNDAHHGDPCSTMPCGARFALWPGAAVFDTARSRALISYTLISAAPGEYNFKGLGWSLAEWKDFNQVAERREVRPGTAHPTVLFAEGEPAYGATLVIDGDTLFSFACDGTGLSRPCTLAKVPLEKAFDRAAWSFWKGSDWSSTIGDGRAVFEGGQGISLTRAFGEWVAVYTKVLSSEVVARTSAQLTGPWSDEVHLFTANRKTDTSWTYDAYVHAELNEASGSVQYVTFTRATGLFQSETALVRVTLRKN